MKKLRTLSLFLVAVLTFTGCQGTNASDTSDEEISTVSNAAVDIPAVSSENTISQYIDEFMGYVKEFDTENISASLDDSSYMDFDELTNIEHLKEYFEENAAKTTYEIISTDEKNLTATVKCHYIDMTDFVASMFVEKMTHSITDSDRARMTKEQITQKENDIIDDAKKGIKDTYDDEEITIQLIKSDNTYKIQSTDDIRYMVTCNYLECMDEIEKAASVFTTSSWEGTKE